MGLLTLVLATGAAYATWSVVSQTGPQVKVVQGEELIPVVVAAQRLLPGAVIGPDDVRMEPRPASDHELLLPSLEMAIGQTVGDLILPGESVRVERLTVGGAGLDIHEVVDPGARAMTVRVDRDIAVGGLLRPGHFVDVLVTISPESDALDANWVTDTVLQGVRVIAVGDEVTGSRTSKEVEVDTRRPRPPRTVFVTVEVSPSEAQALALASSRGKIHLTLRAAEDFEMITYERPLVTNALLGLPEQARQAQAQRLARKKETRSREAVTSQVLEIIRGGRTTVELVDEHGDRVVSGR